jgi:hypothetical protein
MNIRIRSVQADGKIDLTAGKASRKIKSILLAIALFHKFSFNFSLGFLNFHAFYNKTTHHSTNKSDNAAHNQIPKRSVLVKTFAALNNSNADKRPY